MPKEPRSQTIIFRLRKSHHEELEKRHASVKIRDVETVNQFARKIVADFALGRLKYASPEQRLLADS